jgi:hypothetical protein
MKLFHRTWEGERILREGFRDGRGKYLTGETHQGVWFSGFPLNDDARPGDTLLEIEMPENVAVGYEWLEEGKNYREFLIPAALANSYGPPRQVPSAEEAEMPDPRFPEEDPRI